MVDYAMGVLLIAAPWLFGFAAGGAKTWVPVILGACGAIGYSLFTDYELGLVRKISMTTHLGPDAGSGIFPAASPWIFGFADVVYLPTLFSVSWKLGLRSRRRGRRTQTVRVKVRHTRAY